MLKEVFYTNVNGVIVRFIGMWENDKRWYYDRWLPQDVTCAKTCLSWHGKFTSLPVTADIPYRLRIQIWVDASGGRCRATVYELITTWVQYIYAQARPAPVCMSKRWPKVHSEPLLSCQIASWIIGCWIFTATLCSSTRRPWKHSRKLLPSVSATWNSPPKPTPSHSRTTTTMKRRSTVLRWPLKQCRTWWRPSRRMSLGQPVHQYRGPVPCVLVRPRRWLHYHCTMGW